MHRQPLSGQLSYPPFYISHSSSPKIAQHVSRVIQQTSILPTTPPSNNPTPKPKLSSKIGVPKPSPHGTPPAQPHQNCVRPLAKPYDTTEHRPPTHLSPPAPKANGSVSAEILRGNAIADDTVTKDRMSSGLILQDLPPYLAVEGEEEGRLEQSVNGQTG
jgi:hypothetical protein